MQQKVETRMKTSMREQQAVLDQRFQVMHPKEIQRDYPATNSHDPAYHLMSKYYSRPGIGRDSKRHVPFIPARGRQYDKIAQNNLLTDQKKCSKRAWGDTVDPAERLRFENAVKEELGEGDTLDLSE